MRKFALVVIGSRTAENVHGVASGLRVAAALRSRGWTTETLHAGDGAAILRRLVDSPPEVVVPVGFGSPTETGEIAAAARMVGVPCAGPTPAVGALAQDKAAFARLVQSLFKPEARVRAPVGCSITAALSHEDRIGRTAALRTPLLVKPNFSGSSEGMLDTIEVGKALAAVEALLPVEGRILVQELERNIRHEVSLTILDRADGPILLPIVELRRDNVAFMGIEEKFSDQAVSRHIIPARLEPSELHRLEQVALTIRGEIGPIGLSRIDALVLGDGEIIVLEVNGIAGLLPTSIAVDAARAVGMDFADLAEAYVATAFIARPEPKLSDGSA